jgi:hypothetical protein
MVERVNIKESGKIGFDSGIYYQTIDIVTTGVENEYDVELLENFLYCDGVLPVTPNTGDVWAILDKGKYIVDKIPGGFSYTGGLKGREGMMMDINMFAKGTTKRIYLKIPSGNVGNVYTFIFRLTNNAPEHKNKKYVYFNFTAPGSSTYEFDLIFKKTIKKIKGFCCVPNDAFSAQLILSIKDDVRTFIKDVRFLYVKANSDARFFDRMLPIDVKNSNLKLETKNNFVPAANFYIIFEYEEYV